MKFAKCVPDNYPLLEKVEQNFDNFAFINPLLKNVEEKVEEKGVPSGGGFAPVASKKV